MLSILLLVAAHGSLAACVAPQQSSLTSNASEVAVPEAISLLGRSLFRPEPAAETRDALELAVLEAEALVRADFAEENAVWLGRRLAGVYRYRDAIEAYTWGLEGFPDSFKLLRYRGHRYISLRHFDLAVLDLERAADLLYGLPPQYELREKDVSKAHPVTFQHNVFYHLGLAWYLQHEFELALDAYKACLATADNPDMLCGISHWLYMTLRRLGRDAEAAKVLEPIRADMEVRESTAYHRMLLMYKGEIAPEELVPADAEPILAVTLGYGLGNWYLYNGDRERALEIFQKLVETPYWMAFGCIAAEAELVRM